MAIEAVCNSEVVTVPKDAALKDIARTMKNEHVGSVIVTEESEKTPAGIITDRDLVMALASETSDLEGIRAQDIMKSKPFTVMASEGIYETILKMREHGVERMPVVSKSGELCGIVTSDDLLNLMGEEIHNLARITETQREKEEGLRMPSKQVG